MSRGAFIRVGLLVLIAAGLMIGFASLLGGPRLREARAFETYFAESVTGLEIGAPVRFRGVVIGRVSEVGLVNAIYRDPPPDQVFGAPSRWVLVRFEVDISRVGTNIPTPEQAAEAGLRARLASQGVTGIAYIELDFVDPNRFPPFTFWWQPTVPFVPAMPSSLRQVQSAAERLSQRLEEADIPGLLATLSGLLGDLRGEDGIGALLGEAAGLLRDTRRLVAGVDVEGVLGDLRQVTRGVRDLIDSEETRGLMARLSEASRALEGALQRVAPVLASADRTFRRADGTIADVQRDIAPTLRELRAAAANLRAATEALRQDPSRVLFSRPPPRAAEDR